VAGDMCAVNRYFLLDKLDELGVNILLNTRVKEITDKGVVAFNTGGQRQVIKADTVVLCVGFKANKELQSKVEDIVPEVYRIGDCVKPGKIFDAIHGGAFIGRQI
jgi:2-enoate reductase